MAQHRYEKVRESLVEVVREVRDGHPDGHRLSLIDAMDEADRAYDVAVQRHDPTLHAPFEEYARRMAAAALYERLGDFGQAAEQRDSAYRRRR